MSNGNNNRCQETNFPILQISICPLPELFRLDIFLKDLSQPFFGVQRFRSLLQTSPACVQRVNEQPLRFIPSTEAGCYHQAPIRTLLSLCRSLVVLFLIQNKTSYNRLVMMHLSFTPIVPLNQDADGTVRVTGSRVALDTIVSAFKRGNTAEQIQDSFPSPRSPNLRRDCLVYRSP